MAGNADTREGTPYKDRTFPCTLTVFEHVSKQLSPSLLYDKKYTKRQVDHALKKLQEAGFIEKLAYATWEATVPELTREIFERRYTKVHRVTPPEGTRELREGTRAKPDTDRMHAVMVTVQIPKLKNWERRAELLEKKGISFEPIVQGQRISFRDIEKIWLCRESIVMYLPYSWFADTSAAALEKATGDVIAIISGLEKHLGAASFKVGGSYKFRFSKQEHALVKNALAQQYNDKKLKLRVYDDSGLWLLVDDSFSLKELEAVHPESSPDDHRKVQKFFNSLKQNPITTHNVTAMHKDVQEFKGMLQGFMQQSVASANAQMYTGAAMQKQTAILERLEARSRDPPGKRERPADAQPGHRDGILEEISDMLSVLVQDKVLELPRETRETLKKYVTGRTVEVEILQELPRFLVPFRGALRGVGPFMPGARVYIDEQVANVLIEKGAARRLGGSIA